jgi:glutathione S-transferase
MERVLSFIRVSRQISFSSICYTDTSAAPNILQYLGKPLNMAGEDEADFYHINQLTLTALDVSNECHDTHHPLAVMKYYEDQKGAALAKAKDFRENRMPKFFSYFERTLKGNEAGGKGKYLVGNKLSYADTTLWQVVDGLMFAFPEEMDARKKEFPLLFDTFYPSMRERIKAYLQSDRRKEYSMGIFRYYKELDRQ